MSIDLNKKYTTRNGKPVKLIAANNHPSTGVPIVVGMFQQDEKSSKWSHASWNARTGRYVLAAGYEPLNREDRADLDLVDTAPRPANRNIRTYGCYIVPGDTLEVELHRTGISFFTPASITLLDRNAVLDLARYLERCAEYVEARTK